MHSTSDHLPRVTATSNMEPLILIITRSRQIPLRNILSSLVSAEATQPHACPVPANPHEHPSSNHFPPYPFRSPVHALTRQTCKDKHQTGNTGQNKQGRGKETWRVRLCIHSACPSDPGGVKGLAFACDICQPLPCFEGFACVFIQIPCLSMRRFFLNLILSGLSYLSTVPTSHSRRLLYTL